MSSNEDDDDLGHKKRRVQRACDVCRRKKIKCDGIQMPGKRCSNCMGCNYECTYIETAQKRGPPKGYVEALENRIAKMDQLLHRLMPEADFTKEFGPLTTKDKWATDPNKSIPDVMRSVNENSKHRCFPDQLTKLSDVEERLLEEELQHLTLEDNLGNCTPDETQGYRFFGKSSGVQLIRTAMDLKCSYTGDSSKPDRQSFDHSRPEFWSNLPWEGSNGILRSAYPTLSFPEDDLLHTLVDLYFKRVNIFLPLLHQPTFQESVSQGLHLRDEMFGAVLLLVCAVASRYTDDERVLLDGEVSRHSSGWKWFDQVQVIRKSLFNPPGLYDLQLFTEFLSGSSAPHASWTLVGIGIRLAQDVGAHRRKKNTTVNTVESELWKRAFWVLITMDRMTSAALGRPCALHDEDIDIDFPAECDDEYWEHPDPEQAFKQPPGKPSYISYFNANLRLVQLVSFCLRSIYSLNKSKILLGVVGQKWEQEIVLELDSALNKWVDSIPDHLRWDPNRENILHFDQSAHLYISYYHLQILIHRPFIPTPRNPSPLSFPSLAICTNAARSCSHVVDIQIRRSTVIPSTGMTTFTAGIVLLFNIWGGQKSGLSIDPNREMGDVHKCMRMLRGMEKKWHVAGRLWDILYELASAGDLPLPKRGPTSSNKRDRDSDIHRTPAESPPNLSGTDSMGAPSMRPIAGLTRVSKPPNTPSFLQVPAPTLIPPAQHLQHHGHHPPTIQAQKEPPVLMLPTSSHDLGRIPLHDGALASHQQQSGWYDERPSMSVLPEHFNFHNSSFFGMPASNPSVYHPQQQHFDYTGSSSGTSPPQPELFGMGIVDTPPPPQMEMKDTLAMWSSAPSGFELDEWGTYLTNVNEITQGMQGNEGG